MSAEVMEPAANAEAHTSNDPGMGGTSTEDQVREGGAEGDGTQGEQPEGAEPEGGAERTGEEPAPQRSEPAVPPDVARMIDDSQFISRTVLGNPERERMFRKWAQEDSGGGASDGDDRLAASEAAIAKWFKDTDDSAPATALREVTGPLLAEIRDLRKMVSTMQPALRQAHQAAVTGEFSRSLAANGAPANIFEDKGFLKFLSEERRNPDFRRDEAQRPAYAARNLMNAWKARTGQRASNAQQRQHVEDMKGGRLHAAASAAGTNGSQKVHVIDPTKPGYDNQVLAIRTKDPRAVIQYRTAAAK